MFTELNLENYKSFNKISFNMKETKIKPKNMIALYGENGSGKSSIIEAFGILRLSLETLKVTNRLNELNILMSKREDKNFFDEFNIQNFIKMMEYNDLPRLLRNYRTIGKSDNIKLEYLFLLNDKDKGKYIMEFDKSGQIVREELDYTINERMGNIFTITKKNEIEMFLNRSIFHTPDIKKELDNTLKKYWGIHSFFSIFSEITGKMNKSYVKSSVSSKLFEVLSFFLNISVLTESYTAVNQPESLLDDLESGSVELEEAHKIKRTEELLYNFFSGLYVDIKDVIYNTRYLENKIEYELVLKKNIYGELIEVPFSLESKGTKKLLEILPFFLMVVEGGTCFIDEIDNGIHDILMNHLIDNLLDDINGQLVFSTHDTLMLKELPKNSVYFITIDYDGNKRIKSVNDYKQQTLAKNNSLQNQYLKGAFEGVPIPIDIDFEQIFEIITGDVDGEE